MECKQELCVKRMSKMKTETRTVVSKVQRRSRVIMGEREFAMRRGRLVVEERETDVESGIKFCPVRRVKTTGQPGLGRNDILGFRSESEYGPPPSRRKESIRSHSLDRDRGDTVRRKNEQCPVCVQSRLGIGADLHPEITRITGFVRATTVSEFAVSGRRYRGEREQSRMGC